MLKRSSAFTAALAAVALVVTSTASAHSWYWSRATAESALENASTIRVTKSLRFHAGSATCQGYGRWRTGDARRLFQHFRCSGKGQLFGTARERAAKKAYEDAKAAWKEANANGADEATRQALGDTYAEAHQQYAFIRGTGVPAAFKFVLNVEGQNRGSVSRVVRTA